MARGSRSLEVAAASVGSSLVHQQAGMLASLLSIRLCLNKCAAGANDVPNIRPSGGGTADAKQQLSAEILRPHQEAASRQAGRSC